MIMISQGDHIADDDDDIKCEQQHKYYAGDYYTDTPFIMKSFCIVTYVMNTYVSVMLTLKKITSSMTRLHVLLFRHTGTRQMKMSNSSK